jgi:hypothetical protein
MKEYALLRALCTDLARARRRIADLERQLTEAEGRSLTLERDVAFYRQPARDREYCPKCGKPRDRECPLCGETYPE